MFGLRYKKLTTFPTGVVWPLMFIGVLFQVDQRLRQATATTDSKTTTGLPAYHDVKRSKFLALLHDNPESSQPDPASLQRAYKIAAYKARVMAQSDAQGSNGSDVSYVKRFLQWENYNRPPDIGSDVDSDVDRYFTYRCDTITWGRCGGWADRLKGVLFSYLVANLTGRIFKAEFITPKCDMSQFIVPNLYNWSNPSASRDSLGNETTYNFTRYMNNAIFKESIETINFTEYWNHKEKHIVFVSNLEHVGGLQKSKIYSKELSWMKDLSLPDIYAALYKRLFKLAPALQSRLLGILSNVSISQNFHKNRLVCAQVRMGRNKSLKRDSEIRNNMENMPKIWAFINSQLRSSSDRVFIMSDSQEVLDDAQTQPFSDRLIVIPGRIRHVDLVYSCNWGFDKLLLEHHLLMSCDVMVRGHSGLSVLASLIRGSDRDLYDLHKNGTITPGTRADFSNFL